jgi:hypothetical protein
MRLRSGEKLSFRNQQIPLRVVKAFAYKQGLSAEGAKANANHAALRRAVDGVSIKLWDWVFYLMVSEFLGDDGALLVSMV